MAQARSMFREKQFLLLTLIPVYFILVGFYLQPVNEIIRGIYLMVKEPDILITDYFAVGGIGAAFVNASIMMLISIVLTYFLGKEMDGHTITSSCLMFGFSLFGRNRPTPCISWRYGLCWRRPEWGCLCNFIIR